MSQFFTYRDADGVIREAEAFETLDYTTIKEPNKPLMTLPSGFIDSSLINPAGEVKSKTELIVLTQANIDGKKIPLSSTPIYSTFTLVPEGALPQRNGIDFVYVESDNSISWAGLGLDGFLEINETLEVTYFHR